MTAISAMPVLSGGRRCSSSIARELFDGAADIATESRETVPPAARCLVAGAHVQEELHIPLRPEQRRRHPAGDLGAARLESSSNLAQYACPDLGSRTTPLPFDHHCPARLKLWLHEETRSATALASPSKALATIIKENEG